MNTLRSFIETVVTTPTDTFPISFEYDEKYDAVHVFLNDVSVGDLGYTVSQVNAVTLKVEPAIQEGTVRIERETDIDKMKYIFDAGALFIDQNVDADFKQIVHSQQEVRDGFIKLRGDVLPLVHGLQEALQQAQEASEAAQEAANAAEVASAQTLYYLRYYSPDVVYPLNARIMLNNGDIVRSTIANNVNNPNVDMTGWVNFEADQQEVNNFVKDKTISFLDFGAKADGVTDDSVSIGLASTWSSMYKRKVSGLNKEYKCSNVFFDSNCHLVDAKLINNANADLISVLTTAVSRDWLENVTFENIHIDGKRIDQTGVKDSGLGEDGGRHGFRFRRPCRNIRIRKSSANFCASDGICIFPDMFNGGDVVSVVDFVIEDSEFNWNRRHGGSSDRTNGLTLINTKCNFNGRYLEGYESAPANSGAQGDKPYQQNSYYGNGWDSEEYGNHTSSSNLNFINCEMIDNAKGGLLVLAYSAATAVNENIKILGGKYNKGVLNTQDNSAITITPNGLSNTSYIYDDVVIDNVTTDDNILLRNTQNYVVTNTPCTLLSVEYTKGHTDYVTKSVIKTATSFVRMLDGSPYGTFTYSTDGLTQTVTNLSSVINQFVDTESRKQEFKVSTFKFGEIETTVDSATDSTTWKFKTGGANVERFRIGRYGAQMRVSASIPDSSLINESVVFEYVSNTVLKIKMKGSDGVVRSANLTLA